MGARRIAVAVLITKKGQVVLQRRTADDKAHPGMLGLFGGHMENDELPLQALLRELGEETSLKIRRQAPEKIAEQHWYKLYIPDTRFEVYEGDGAETLSIDEALKRHDLTYSTRNRGVFNASK